MNTIHVVLLPMIVLAGIPFACAGNQGVSPGQEKPDVRASLADGNNAFALDLYGGLKGQEGNLFFSPFSISTALAMTYGGARGETASQMAKVLCFASDEGRVHGAFKELLDRLNAKQEKPAYELIVANALWGQKGFGFLDDFVGLVRTNYGAGFSELDFAAAAEAARQTINAWVEQQTKQKIRDLVKPGVLKESTRLVLTNAIYFKGKWSRPFGKGATAPMPFLAGGKKTNVPMMHQQGKFRYGENTDLQILELPYEGGSLSMLVLLPKAVDGLPKLEASLTAEKLGQWTGNLRQADVFLYLPKFEMTLEFSLGRKLAEMGMADALNPGKADFSGMNGKRDLFLSEVIHKAFVEVNEEGTEAAAATGAVMALTSVMVTDRVVFRADHPFLFLIRHNETGSILFMGRVANP